MKKAIVVFGSSRSDGNTKKAIRELDPKGELKIADLNTMDITAYDYEHKNKDDDFIPLMEEILKYDTIVLATPEYWYTMSAQLKIFLDRITDCMTIRKDIGRALKGKRVFLLVSYDVTYPTPAFVHPIKSTCEYLEIEYCGEFFHYSGDKKEGLEKNKKIEEFAKQIQGTTS